MKFDWNVFWGVLLSKIIWHMYVVSVTGNKGKEQSPGIIIYDVNGTKQTIPYSAKVIQSNIPRNGDKVRYMEYIYVEYSSSSI